MQSLVLLYWCVNKNTLLLCLIQSSLIGSNESFNRIEIFAFIKCTAIFGLHIMANRSIFSWLRFPVLLYSSLNVIQLESPLHLNFQKKCTETFMSYTHPIHNIKWSRLDTGQGTPASNTPDTHSKQQQTPKWQTCVMFGLEHNFRLIHCLHCHWTHPHAQNYSNVIKSQIFYLGF